MQMTRRTVIGLFGGGALTLAGCGGGGNNDSASDAVTVKTETDGRVADGFLAPRPGQAFISRTTVFQIAWESTNPPPAQWKAALRRYREALGGESRDISTQKVTVDRVGTDYRWNIRRRDSFQLDTSGIYFLELSDTVGGFEQIAYMVDESRSAGTRSVTVSTGGNGVLRDVVVTPRAGSCFISSDTNFTIEWAISTPPPPDVRIELRRYKEQRGSDSRTDEEQKVEAIRIDSRPYAWTVRRKDNFRMDKGGVYYIALRADGQDPYYAAYIIADY